jgi:glutamine amidotransferase
MQIGVPKETVEGERRVALVPDIVGKLAHGPDEAGGAAVEVMVQRGAGDGALIPDELYDARLGTTDSEAIFLAALANGLAEDPVGAMARTLKAVRGMMREAGVDEPLRFTAALTDGESLYAFRWACDDRPPSLYWREAESGLIVVSEPIDGRRDGWREVPKGCTLIARTGRPVAVECLNAAMAKLAA